MYRNGSRRVPGHVNDPRRSRHVEHLSVGKRQQGGHRWDSESAVPRGVPQETGHRPYLYQAPSRVRFREHRRFAHANPATYGLLIGAGSVEGADARSRRSSATLLARVAEVAGPENALPAARTLVAWAHGFIGMTLADSFLLGGDIEEAWTFGLERVLEAIDSRNTR
jgi:hypothetical protein